MKKIYLLFLLLVSTTLVQAQTFSSCSEYPLSDLTAIINGDSTITVTFTNTGSPATRNIVFQIYCGTVATGNLMAQNPSFPSCDNQAVGGGGGSYEATFTAEIMSGAPICDVADLYIVIGLSRPGSSACNNEAIPRFEAALNGGPCPLGSIGGGTLPVILSDFNVERKKEMVYLSWKTVSEMNFKAFEVEVLKGDSWSTVGSVTGKNASEGSTYSFQDINTYAGVSIYRLKMIDINGGFAYSDLKSVLYKNTSAVSIFPNPSYGHGKILITPSADPIDVTISDNLGREVRKMLVSPGSGEVNFDGILSGQYIIRTINKATGEINTQKFIVAE